MGGVGQAALQFCRYVGATVIASAGTSEKRDRLMADFPPTANWPGILAILDSRDPENFFPKVMQATHNRSAPNLYVKF